MNDDQGLLRSYAIEGSEKAFAELVRRHVDLVYAVALRRLEGRASAAEEVTQRVFIDLSRKASSLMKRPLLVSWLHVSTRHAAAEYARSEARRKLREHAAFMMNENSPDSPALQAERLKPLLDDAIAELSEIDREAVLLRFFENQAFVEIGGVLRLSEDTARKRVDRAVEKLRKQLIRRGVTSTQAALSLVLAQSAVAAPTALAAQVTAATLASTTALGAVGGGGLILSYLAMTKLELGTFIALVLGGAALGLNELSAHRSLQTEVDALKRERTELLDSSKNIPVSTTPRAESENNPALDSAELAKTRARLAVLKARPAGVIDAEIKPLENRGLATPDAALMTIFWIGENGSLAEKVSLIRFRDDTPENRATFMGFLSEAMRAKYQTPERFIADVVFPLEPAWAPVALQVRNVNSKGLGVAVVSAWFRMQTGQEMGMPTVLERDSVGWTLEAMPLNSAELRDRMFKRIDPITGVRLSYNSPNPAR